MNQITRTSIFLGAAAVSIGLAVLTGLANRPSETVGGYELGTPFFPDFDDPLVATALQVATFDEDAATVKVFKVEKRNGIWRIPSHHNYPADGEDRLAKTATSMLGVERGALVSTSPADHKRYHVLDPLDEAPSGTEGYGDRITLYQDDSKLLDLIVGEQVEDQTDVYYVRKPDENQIYRAKLGTVDLSTKFADWIEQDLLQVNSSDLVEMVVNPYHIDEVQGLKVQDEEPILLERKPATSSWKLAGIDESEEKEKVSVINAMSRALADLEIVGVRRKPESLIALFRGEEDVRLTTSEMLQMQSAGFFVIPPGEFVANEGEVQAGTKEGIRYRLQFGEVFTGTDVEIEVGSTGGDAEEETGDDTETADDEANDEDELDLSDPSQQRSRYLFVSVIFDESLLGDRPEPPVPPTPPGEEPAAETSEGNPETPADQAPGETSDESAPDTASEGDAAADEGEPTDNNGGETTAGDANDSDADDTTADDAEAAADGDDADTPTAQEIYEQEQAAYETAREQYEEDLAEYEEKVEAGTKRAEDLNRRFAEWYYVISADLYEDLKVSRSDLVEPAEPEDSEAATDTPDPGSLLPGERPAESSDDAAAPANGSNPEEASESSAADAPGSSESAPADRDSSATPPESSETSEDSGDGEASAPEDSGTDESD